MKWNFEEEPIWDEKKIEIIMNNEGSFNFELLIKGGKLPGTWFDITDDMDNILGYGWIDVKIKEYPEISVAVKQGNRNNGVGSEILKNLCSEVKKMNYCKVIAIVKQENQNGPQVLKWAYNNGFVVDWPGYDNMSIKMAINHLKLIDIKLKKSL